MVARVILLACAPALLGAAVIAGGAADRIRPPLAAFSAAQWTPRVGDVILTSDDDLIGSQIRSASGEGAIHSHVGLVVRRDDSLAVIEATPFGQGGVGYADLAAFITAPGLEQVTILRPRGFLDTGRLDRAAARLAAAHVAFDYDLDADDGGALYCAELVADLLREGGVDLDGLRRVPMQIPMTGPRDVIVPDAFTLVPALVPVATQVRTPA